MERITGIDAARDGRFAGIIKRIAAVGGSVLIGSVASLVIASAHTVTSTTTQHGSASSISAPDSTSPSPSPSISPSPSPTATPSPSPSPTSPPGPTPTPSPTGGVGGISTPGTGSGEAGNLGIGGVLVLGGPALALLGVLARGYMRRHQG